MRFFISLGTSYLIPVAPAAGGGIRSLDLTLGERRGSRFAERFPRAGMHALDLSCVVRPRRRVGAMAWTITWTMATRRVRRLSRRFACFAGLLTEGSRKAAPRGYGLESASICAICGCILDAGCWM